MPKSINFLKFIIFFTKVFAILVLFIFGIWAIWEFPQQQVQPLKQQIDILKRSKADPKDIATQLKGRIEVENTTRNGAIQAIGGLLVFVTLYISWQNLKVTEAKQVAERFSKAVEQLGSENIHTRLGGIYALEQIAKDAEEKYYRQVMETLSAYVREKSPFPSLESQEKTQGTEDIPRLPTDIQAVMTVLSRRKYSHNNGEDYRLDLRKTDLRGLQLLAGAKLQGVNFQEACLEKAILQEAKLQGAWFAKADLQGVNLSNAKLQEVDLRQTDLKGGKFKQANLQRADLSMANLQGADFTQANMQQAHLTGANLQGACFDKANLQRAHLEGVNCQLKNVNPHLLVVSVYFGEADLQEAVLTEANLYKAIITDAHLKRAVLTKVNLEQAVLKGSDFKKADFTNVIGLTWEQLQQADSYEGALLPDYLFRNNQPLQQRET
jgi:uncharacterized protein YjbI with pentapeptide repeats